MGKVAHWVAVVGVAASAVACGGDDEKGNPSGSADNICKEQIACGYQLADQATCVELFQAFFTPERIADCDACVSAEPCDTEQDTCTQVCSL